MFFTASLSLFFLLYERFPYIYIYTGTEQVFFIYTCKITSFPLHIDHTLPSHYERTCVSFSSKNDTSKRIVWTIKHTHVLDVCVWTHNFNLLPCQVSHASRLFFSNSLNYYYYYYYYFRILYIVVFLYSSPVFRVILIITTINKRK